MTDRLFRRCAWLASTTAFHATVVTAILLNAVVLGLETYDGIVDRWGDELDLLNAIFLGLFTVEIAIRILACGPRVHRYFASGWNVFDAVVIGSAYLPFVRESVTLVRLLRLLRVARLISVLPGLRVVIRGLMRSIAPLASVAVLTVFLLYVYGMIGWLWFGDDDAEHFGNAGTAMLTMFQILTLEGWNDVMETSLDQTAWAWVFYVSFILVGSFLVLNLVIAIVLNSVEEARTEEQRRHRLERAVQAGVEGHPQLLEQRLEDLRGALAALEDELAREPVRRA